MESQSPCRLIPCEVCETTIPEPLIVSHLEACSVGPIPFEEAKMTCGVCPYRVTKDKLNLMVLHCSNSGHDPKTVRLDWNKFLECEERRTQTLLSRGVDMRGRISIRVPPSPSDFSETAEKSVLSRPVSILQPLAVKHTAPKTSSSKRKSKSTRKVSTNQSEEAAPKLPRMSNLSMHSDESSPMKSEASPTKLVINENVEEVLDTVFREEDSMNEGEDGNGTTISDTKPNLEAPKTGRLISLCQGCENYSLKGKVVWTAMRHVFTHKPQIKPYKCSQCDFVSGRKDSFLKHAEKSGCPTDFIIECDAEVDEEIRNRLLLCFPQIEWNKRVKGPMRDQIPSK